MKITKAQLKKIIFEELKQAVDATKLDVRTASDAARKKGALDRIADNSKEFTGAEKGLVDQIEKYISDLAALPGVDLAQHRSVLQRILKQLEALVGKKHRGSPDGE